MAGACALVALTIRRHRQRPAATRGGRTQIPRRTEGQGQKCLRVLALEQEGLELVLACEPE